MAHSLELRVPFLDLELMQLVERIPAELKLRGLTRKYVWKRAARRWLPDQIVYRPKRGFETPVDLWFQRELSSSIRDTLLAPEAAARRYFEPPVLDRLIQEHLEGRENHQRHLFGLLCFELWHQMFVDGNLSVRVARGREAALR